MNRHIFLNNDRSSHPKFNRQRNVGGSKKNVEEIEDNEPKIIQEFQKERLREFNISFYTKQKIRNKARSIEFEQYIDLIKINFYNTFNSDLKQKFLSKYGLAPIEYKAFNKTVIFEIYDFGLFANFKEHIKKVVDSPHGTSYNNKDYNLLALIYKFEFIDSNARIFTYNKKGVLLNFIENIDSKYDIQKHALFTFLTNNEFNFSYSERHESILEIQVIKKEEIQFIADNFDIVRAITSSRTQKLNPGYNGPIRDYEFEIDVLDNITTVGIIDTGVEKIRPLKSVILNENIDHTETGAFWDEVGHGTMVAGLTVLGDDFYNIIKDRYIAKAKIFVIKVLQQGNDPLDIPRLLNDIKFAKDEYGIRIFNMSLVIPNAKKYNESFSSFAFELDKIAYEQDVLIFISVGNFNSDSLKSLVDDESHPDHEYPDFFYKLDSTTIVHTCEDTNICVPSESLNNISIGALAGNFEKDYNSDITPNEIYPAYYTRKFHYDYSQTINTQALKQKNKHLNKPDFVFFGGDLFDEKSGLEILRSPLATSDKFYGRSSGTSLAAPLVTSYAAEILNEYPNLKTQTVKALLINSAKYPSKNALPHFKYKSESLLKSLIGFGIPRKEALLINENNSITFIVEDSIKINEIIKIPIFLPEYLKRSGNKLQFDISLCYSFMPIKDNQLDYLPLHISFNLIKNIEDITIFETANQSDYSIKNSISWSEDHFGIDNRQFSNSQFMSYRIQPTDFNILNDMTSIVVRCLAKNEHLDSLNHSHNFSLIIKITEILSNENTGNLYLEMLEVNEFIEIQNNNDLDLEAEN
ncbi:S8 family peptidase [Chryseobacterium caseinilyticum]|uniref:S8 family peptidase n=1 Tax=Chryseobacterium caseinilyticum TaxID=2771428 RepID=A0ABR8ZAB6_9FLAO|nr:S8 family peptidase [Chryseobacterium caseinilyticum]MBD8082250.1 S8 family peptidase [Chryseobacterium caseinilyticum]